MKMLITALALTFLVAVPTFTQPVAAAAHKAGGDAAAAARKGARDACQLGQNDQCYWRGYPLWQWYSS
jgi:hypothetical protein